MKLSEQQEQAVRGWLAEGASLADVQARLKDEFALHLTYMDVRLLVLDIGAAVKDKPEPKPVEPKTVDLEDDAAVPLPEGAPVDEKDAAPLDDAVPPPAAGAAKVTLVVDDIMVPGAMVSGTITFTDGVKAKWLIDQYGRFDLEPDKPGYRPTDADLQDLQLKLRAALQRKGLM